MSVCLLMSNFKQETLSLEQVLRRRCPPRAEVRICSSQCDTQDSKGSWTRRASAAPGRGPWLEAVPAVPQPSPQTQCRALAGSPNGPTPSGRQCSRHDQDSRGKQEQQQAVLSLPLSYPLGLVLSLVSHLQQGMSRSSEHSGICHC